MKDLKQESKVREYTHFHVDLRVDNGWSLEDESESDGPVRDDEVKERQ